MRRKNIQDERVLAQRQKISNEAYDILMIALFFSMLFQQFFLDAPFAQYAAEAICFFGMCVYTIVRYITLGLDLYGEGKRAKSITLVNSIGVGITVTLINGVINYTRYIERYRADGIGLFIAVLGVTFISATLICLISMSFLNYLNKKKQAKIKKQLDEEEENQ